METKLSNEDMDEIINRMLERIKAGELWCRKCDKKLGFEDAFVLCVSCQNDIGTKRLKDLVEKENKK